MIPIGAINTLDSELFSSGLLIKSKNIAISDIRCPGQRLPLMLLRARQRQPTKTRDKAGKAHRQGAKTKAGSRQRPSRLHRPPASIFQSNDRTSSPCAHPTSPIWARITSPDFHLLLRLPEGLRCRRQFHQLQGLLRSRS